MNLVRCREADSEQSSSKSVEPILEYFDVNSRFSCAAADLRFAATQMPFEDFLTLRNQLKEKTRSGLNIAEVSIYPRLSVFVVPNANYI